MSEFDGKRMKQRRKELDYTLQELADKSNSSKSYIWELERGTTEPSASKCYLIAQALGVQMEWLCGGEAIGSFAATVGVKVINALGLKA